MNLSEIKLQSIPETEKGLEIVNQQHLQTGFAVVGYSKGEIHPYVLNNNSNTSILIADQNLLLQLNQVMEKVKNENFRKRICKM